MTEAIEHVWPAAVTQTCVARLLRHSFRHAGRQHWAAVARAAEFVHRSGVPR